MAVRLATAVWRTEALIPVAGTVLGDRHQQFRPSVQRTDGIVKGVPTNRSLECDTMCHRRDAWIAETAPEEREEPTLEELLGEETAETETEPERDAEEPTVEATADD